MTSNHHHHSHSHHHIDDAEQFKRSALRSKKMRKTIARTLFAAMCLAALAIFGFLAWAIATGE